MEEIQTKFQIQFAKKEKLKKKKKTFVNQYAMYLLVFDVIKNSEILNINILISIKSSV